jgi:hypothetical protein
MCQQCNYEELLSAVDLGATINRVRGQDVVGGNKFSLSASNIYSILQ